MKQTTILKQIALWFRAMRIHFLQASILPVILGSALAYREGSFSWGLFGVIVMAIGAINIGTNLANDYYDHLSGADDRNPRPTPFSGGSRVIQEGLMPPGRILLVSIISYTVSVVLGLYLIYRSGWGLLLFGIPGVGLSFFYTAPPLRLGYKGLGEPLVGILLGPMAVMGTFYVYTGTVTSQAFLLSLPIGFLVTGILYINQFPDAESDAACGKLHWIARIGRKKSVKGYYMIIGAAYLSLILPVFPRILPPWTLLALLSLPLAVQSSLILRRSYDNTEQLLSAMALTILAHLVTGLLLFAGLMIDHFI